MDGMHPHFCGTSESPGHRAAVMIALLLLLFAGRPTQVIAQADDLISFDTRPPKLMVLFDGRVLYGQISERPGGYMIEGTDGKQVIPFQLIRLTASSLEDAYVKQRDALRMPIAGDHLQLARWCYENKLYGNAKEQIASALKLEPDRSDARQLLQDVENASPPDELPGERGPRSAAGAALEREFTAAGISTNAHAEFVRRVQPILVNRCGNASCHGSAAQNDFQLANVRTGHRQQRRETESNLATVLRFVDPQSPGDSRLLTQTANADSGAHRALFTGPGGAAQLEKLRAWVRSASRDLRGPESTPSWASSESDFARPTGFAFDDSFPADANATPAGDSEVRRAAFETSSDLESPLLIEIPRETAKPQAAPVVSPLKDVSASPTGPAAKSKAEQAAFLRTFLDQDRPDAFDPNEFNRKVHGGAGER